MKELGIKQYHVHTSLFPKISLVERVIKSCKQIFFKIIFQFKTLNNIKDILQLTALIYNNRKHTSLFQNTPFSVHFNSHISAKVAKLSLAQFNTRQAKIHHIFSLKPGSTFQIGEKVLLKKKRHTFHKSNPLFHPHFESEISTITNVDKKFLPWTYIISSHPEKKFYFFELRRITPSYENLNKPQPSGDQKSKIFVKDFLIENPPTLRSGKSLPKRKTIFYIIERGGKTEKVDADSLHFFKKVLGKNVLYYGSIFDQSQNRHLII